MKGWPHYHAAYAIMPKRIKGTHVFRPSDGSKGTAFNNIRPSKPATASAATSSVAVPPASPLPESPAGDDHPSPPDLAPQSSPIQPPRSVSPSIMTTSSTG